MDVVVVLVVTYKESNIKLPHIMAAIYSWSMKRTNHVPVTLCICDADVPRRVERRFHARYDLCVQYYSNFIA